MNREQAHEILMKYMKGENYIVHSYAVEAIMKGLATVSYTHLYAKGYIEGCAGRLTRKEIELMPMGAKTMTFECGMRFLTDCLLYTSGSQIISLLLL